MALQQPFGDIGIPDRDRDGDELARHTRLGQQRPPNRAAPQPASHNPATSRALTTTPPSTTCDASATAKS